MLELTNETHQTCIVGLGARTPVGGSRYLLGRPICGENLRQILRAGLQRQRYAAALELAMMKAGQPLFEVRAPGLRQKSLLEENKPKPVPFNTDREEGTRSRLPTSDFAAGKA